MSVATTSFQRSEDNESNCRMVLCVTSLDGTQLVRSFPPDFDVTLGRDGKCHVVLPSRFVSRVHARITIREGSFHLCDLSRMGTKVEGKTLIQTTAIFSERELTVCIGPYKVEARHVEAARPSAETRRSIHSRLLSELNLESRRIDEERSEALQREVRATLMQVVAEPQWGLDGFAQKRLARELADEALGLGPLEGLLADDTVSEIMVVDPDTIYVERAGRVELTERTFTDKEAVQSVIERIVTPLGRRVDESSPMVDARLPDGSRVNAIIPPLTLRGPCITIRKFPRHRLTMDELVEHGSLSARMARFLERSVVLRKNIVISGGTGSGKTTLLNVLSAFIEPTERIVTIEDAAELNLAQPHVVGLESKPANLEGKGEVPIFLLVKNALRMRPDRILVGECRGGETLDMLQAMNTGHEGSMTTTHANSPAQALARLETLALMAKVELPLFAIRRQIASSIDLVLQQTRLADGSRRVTSVAEVVGLDEEGNLEVRELFRLESDRQIGAFVHASTGFMPSYLPDLERHFGDRDEEVF